MWIIHRPYGRQYHRNNRGVPTDKVTDFRQNFDGIILQPRSGFFRRVAHPHFFRTQVVLEEVLKANGASDIVKIVHQDFLSQVFLGLGVRVKS